MNNDNVTDINVNSAPLTNEDHARAWHVSVQEDNVQGVIDALNAYAVDAGIVSIEAYMEMKVMLHDAMPSAAYVAYTPSKGWFDARLART